MLDKKPKSLEFVESFGYKNPKIKKGLAANLMKEVDYKFTYHIAKELDLTEKTIMNYLRLFSTGSKMKFLYKCWKNNGRIDEDLWEYAKIVIGTSQYYKEVLND